MEIKIEKWCDHEIRFVYFKDEWWAVLKDICDALDLRTDGVSKRLDPDMLDRVPISDHTSTGVRSRGENETRWMLVVNEIGIYEALFASKRLEARKLRRWTATVLRRLRRHVGLEGYEVMQMTDSEVQEAIDDFLDTIFYDEKTKQLMTSITIAGGDVEQVPVDFNLGEL